MRKTFAFASALLLLISCFLACSKKSGFDDFPDHQYPPVFQTYGEAGNALVQHFLRAGQGEQLVQVENIVFLESGNKSYALVFYESNLGHRNIMYEKTYQDGQLVLTTTYECIGTNCDCKVVTKIGQLGEVNISCSCSTCTLLINHY